MYFLILDGRSAPVTGWYVPTKWVSQGSKRGRKPYSESEFFFFRIHANKKKSNISVSRSDFDSQCKPGASSSWAEFDFYFAIENSRSFKTVICSTNSSSHCLSRDAEHIRLTAFRWHCDEGEMRVTCLEAQKSIQRKVVMNSWKVYYDTEDTFSRNRLEGFFDIIRRNEKVHRHSVKKCTKYPFDSRAHLKTVRCLWFPTSDRLETWLIPSGTIRSKQYHESRMVWRNLPSYHRTLIVLTSALSRSFRRKGQDKVPKNDCMGADCIRLWLTRDIV